MFDPTAVCSHADASFKLSDAETEHISLIDSNITDQSESTDVCASSDGSKKSDRINNQQVRSGVVQTESTEGLEVEQASLEVPTHQDWQGSPASSSCSTHLHFSSAKKD